MGGAQSTSTQALPFDVIDLTPTTVVAYRPAPVVDHGAPSGSFSAGGRVAVAPGDLLHVRVFEPYTGNVFPTITQPGADLGTQRVSDDGTIEVPYAGIVKVAGLDLAQIEQRIAQQLSPKVQDSTVIVELVSDRTHTVMVSGDVKSPGRFSILDGTRSVVDAISRAGGPGRSGGTGTTTTGFSASQVEVVVRRNRQVILTSQYSDLLAGGDIPVQKGDEIVVRLNVRSFIVMGAVAKNSPAAGAAAKASNVVELTKSNTTLLEALGEVGGLNDLRSNKTGVFVFRMGDLETNPEARGRVFRLDLLQPVSIFVAQQFAIQPKDVVYVTNAPLYEYNKLLDSVYRTFAIIGVAKGSVIPSTSF
jgi:polysaccharide export outer membrane protein